MRPTRTVIVLSDVERERSLLKSLLASFGQRPRCFWQHIEEGIADVAVVSVDNPSLAVICQAQKLAKVVVFYARSGDFTRLEDQPFKLDKSARARDFLGMLERLEDYFEQEASLPAARQAVTPARQPVPEAVNGYGHALAC